MRNTEYFDVRNQYVQWKLNTALLDKISKIDKKYDKITVICIGTDRSTGDSFGPLTGHMLSKLSLLHFDLYGTLEKPVHALSIEEVMKDIDIKSSLVIAVDAGMGDADMIGNIGIGFEPVRPGSGLGKALPDVGDISITGIVAMGGIAPFIMLQNAPLGLVYDMAEKSFFAIQYALRITELRKRVGNSVKSSFSVPNINISRSL